MTFGGNSQSDLDVWTHEAFLSAMGDIHCKAMGRPPSLSFPRYDVHYVRTNIEQICRVYKYDASLAMRVHIEHVNITCKEYARTLVALFML